MRTSTNRSNKVKVVTQIQQDLAKTNFLLLLSYSRLQVSHFQQLKQDLKAIAQSDSPIALKVYKNTLLQKAIANTLWKELNTFLKGPTFTVISNKDQLPAVKTVFKFVNQHKFVDFKIGFFDQQFLNPLQLQELAVLPGKEQLLGQLINSLRFGLLYLVLILQALTDKVGQTQK